MFAWMKLAGTGDGKGYRGRSRGGSTAGACKANCVAASGGLGGGWCRNSKLDRPHPSSQAGEASKATMGKGTREGQRIFHHTSQEVRLARRNTPETSRPEKPRKVWTPFVTNNQCTHA